MSAPMKLCRVRWADRRWVRLAREPVRTADWTAALIGLLLALTGCSSDEWIGRMKKLIKAERIAGLKVFMRTRGIRSIRFNREDDDLSLRIKGPRLETLEKLGDQVVERLKGIEGLRNLQHSNEDVTQELSIRLDRERAASYGLDVEDVGNVLRFALEGKVVTDFIVRDRSIDVLLRLDRLDVGAPGDLEFIVLFSKTEPRVPIRLGDLADVAILPQPSTILRDRQQRMVEVFSFSSIGPKQRHNLTYMTLPPCVTFSQNVSSSSGLTNIQKQIHA